MTLGHQVSYSYLSEELYSSTKKLRNVLGSSPVTGLEWSRGFQKVKVPRLHNKGTGWW
jgi:hypothetical protein